MPNHRPTPAHVLAVFAEPLVRDRRCALIGPDDDGVSGLLVELGARHVHVYSPAPAPGATGARLGDPLIARGPRDARVLVTLFPVGAGVREGAFDVAIVPDLARLGDHESALATVRRLVGSAGAAVIACRNVDAGSPWLAAATAPPPPSYGEFYDLCALQFAEVRVLGVAPFAAYAVAEFSPEQEPAIAFDSSLVSAVDPPEWFVAVASQRPLDGTRSGSTIESYQIVQVPRAALANVAPTALSPSVSSARAGATDTDSARALEQELAVARLQQERDRFAAEAATFRQAGAELTAAKEELRRRLLARERELDASLTRAKLLEDRLADQLAESSRIGNDEEETRERLGHVGDLERTALEAVAEARAAKDRLALAHEELRATRAASRGVQEEARAVHEVARIAQAEARLTQESAARVLTELVEVQRMHEEEVATLEATLRARGEELRAARIELGRRERLVRELVTQVEDAHGVAHAQATASVTQAPAPAVAPPDHGVSAPGLGVEEPLPAPRELVMRAEEAAATIAALGAQLEAERAKNEELARDAARREAALQTASWQIAELEKLGTAGAGETDGARRAPDARDEEARHRLEGELDALRRALVQEHELRQSLERQVTAEAGTQPGELARIQARLDEREALIAQLSAELAAARTSG